MIDKEEDRFLCPWCLGKDKNCGLCDEDGLMSDEHYHLLEISLYDLDDVG